MGENQDVFCSLLTYIKSSLALASMLSSNCPSLSSKKVHVAHHPDDKWV